MPASPHRLCPHLTFTFLDVSRFVVGALLLASATLKLHLLLTAAPVVSNDWLATPLVQWLAVGWESALALWLFTGWRAKVSRMLAISTFGTFAVVSLRQVVIGQTSCGCFGELTVNPWIVFWMDVAVLAFLTMWDPERATAEKRRGWSRPIMSGGLVAIAALAATVVNLSLAGARQLSDDLPMSDSTVIVEPEQWLGKKFPLIHHIEANESLVSGRWLVLFHRQDCEACKPAIPAVLSYAYDHQDDSDRKRVAIIEVPMANSPKPLSVTPGRLCSRGHLNSSHNWRVQTPLICSVHDGVLESYAQSLGDLLAQTDVIPEPSLGNWGTAHGFPDYSLLVKRIYQREFACGPLALLAVLKHLGQAVSPEQTEKLVRVAGSRGTDMNQLKSLAESRGLHAIGVETNVSGLRELGYPAIVHVNHVAFAAVLGYETDGLLVSYSGKPPVIVPDNDLARSFGKHGRALLLSQNTIDVSHDPLVADGVSQSRLRPERTCATVGQLHNNSWQVKIKVWNDGDIPMQIRDLVAIRDPRIPCCESSVSAELHPQVIAPKTYSTLCVAGKHLRLGGFSHSVRIEPESKDVSPLLLPVRGVLMPGVIPVRPAFEFPLTELKASSTIEIPLVRVAQDSKQCDFHVVVPKDVPIRSEVIGSNDALRLRLTWLGIDTPGWHRHVLLIRDQAADDRIAAPIVVAVEVCAGLQAFPTVISLSDEELSQGWSRRIRMRSIRPMADLRANWSDERLDKDVRVNTTVLDQHHALVVLDGKRLARDSQWMRGSSAQLTFTTDGSNQVGVPVRFGNRQLSAEDGMTIWDARKAALGSRSSNKAVQSVVQSGG